MKNNINTSPSKLREKENETNKDKDKEKVKGIENEKANNRKLNLSLINKNIQSLSKAVNPIFSVNNTPKESFNTNDFNLLESQSDYGFNQTENIKVFLRVRPLNQLETNRGDAKIIELANNQMIFFSNKNLSRNYSFNQCFGEFSTQKDVYDNTQISVSNFFL
jgi:hypothetical protein